MKVGIPKEVKNHEYRVAITPAGVHELVRAGHEVFVERDAGAGSAIPDEDFVAAGAAILPDADEVWQAAELVLKVKEPVAEEYHRLRKGQVLFTYLHLAASRECTDALLESGITAIAYETVQLADGSLPLLAPMSEVAGRMAPQVGRAPPAARRRRPRRADGRGVRRLRGQGGRARGGRVGHERRRDRARHAGRGAAGGQEHRPAALGGRHLPGPPPDRRVQRLRDRARGDRRRPGHRRGAGAGRQGADAGLQRAGVPDEAGLGAGGHLHRPGRLLRGLPPHHPRRPDLPGAQLAVLLRREHAGRGAAHLDLRADQRHPAVRGRDREPRLAGRAARGPGARAGAEHLRGLPHLPQRRRGARPAVDSDRAR